MNLRRKKEQKEREFDRNKSRWKKRKPGLEKREGIGRVGEDVEAEGDEGEKRESEAVAEEGGREGGKEANYEDDDDGSLPVHQRGHGRHFNCLFPFPFSLNNYISSVHYRDMEEIGRSWRWDGTTLTTSQTNFYLKNKCSTYYYYYYFTKSKFVLNFKLQGQDVFVYKFAFY